MSKTHLIREASGAVGKTWCGYVGRRYDTSFYYARDTGSFRALTERQSVYNADGVTCNKCREITGRRKII